jgi:hypothetical protein
MLYFALISEFRLKRTHCRQCAKLMVQRRYSHARNRGEFVHAQGLCEVRFQPGDGSRGSVAEAACG